MAARQHKIPQAGAPAPGFDLPGLDGGTVSLQELLAQRSRAAGVLQDHLPGLPDHVPVSPPAARCQGDPRLRDFAERRRRDTREFMTSSESVFRPAGQRGGRLRGEQRLRDFERPTLFVVEPGGRIANRDRGLAKDEIEGLGASAAGDLFRAGENVPEWKAG